MNNIADIRDTRADSPIGASVDRPNPPSGATHRYTSGRSTLEVKEGIWHLRARESGYRETGLAIGRLLAAADYPAVRVFSSKYARSVVSLLYAVTKRDFRRIRIPECYLEELHGYAEGSGLPYWLLFFMNFVFDILKKYGFHCSSVAFAQPGEAMVGRNTDLIPWIAKLTLKWFPPVLLDIVVPGTLRYVHVTPGLFLGVLGGFNERGMAMMSHQIGATKERVRSRQPRDAASAADDPRGGDGHGPRGVDHPCEPGPTLHQQLGDVEHRGHELHLRDNARIDQDDPHDRLLSCAAPPTSRTVSSRSCSATNPPSAKAASRS